jgi:hypothetical protein
LNIAPRKRRRRTSKHPTLSSKWEDTLRSDEFTAHSSDETTLALIAEVSEEADELILISSLGGNVIPLVVRVRAWKSLAARHRSWAVLGEDLLDTVDVGGVDNGGDVEVGGAGVAVEAQFSEHAWDVCGSLGDGVEVADPACGEGLVVGLVAFDGERLDCWEAFLSSEVDGSLGGVLVDKVD